MVFFSDVFSHSCVCVYFTWICLGLSSTVLWIKFNVAHLLFILARTMVINVVVENIDALSQSVELVRALQIANANNSKIKNKNVARVYAKFSSASWQTILLFQNQRTHSICNAKKKDELFTEEVTSIYCLANF